MSLRLVRNSRIGRKCLASFVLYIRKVIEGVSHALPFFYFHRFTLGILQECSVLGLRVGSWMRERKMPKEMQARGR
jgi:hypothetical protein